MHLDMEFDQEVLNQYYVEDYRKEFTSELGRPDEAAKFFADQLPLARRRMELLRPFLGANQEDPSCLEIGCGPGYFLQELQQVSQAVFGLELSTAHAEYARGLGLAIYEEPLEKVQFDRSFDLIFLFHVLEHIADPEAYLKTLKSLLTAEGRIVVEVPGISDALIQLYRVPGFRSFYFQEPHLYYFTEESLQLLGAELGLSVEFRSFNQYGLINHLSWALTGRSNVSKRADGATATTLTLEDQRLGDELFGELNDYYLRLLERHGFKDTIFAVMSRS
jgi:SAM-dependent methyltransferase